MPYLIKARQEWLKWQRAIYLKNRRLIAESIRNTDPAMTAYQKRYLRGVNSFESISNNEEMMSQVMQAQIVYVGDYHTLNQSQRSFLRILREAITHKKKIGIALEVLEARHQNLIDDFLSNPLTEKKEEKFLQEIGFRKHWFFDLWPNFRPLFEFAIAEKIPLVGIEAPHRRERALKERDQAMAKVIYHTVNKDPDRLWFVFVGDWHIARGHLPFQVNQLFRKNKEVVPRSVTLFQNSDALYWDLAKEGLETEATVLKISDHEFCRQHTPPVIAQQSFLNWLNQESGVIDTEEARNQFLESIRLIAKYFQIELTDQLDHVEILTAGEVPTVSHLQNHLGLTSDEWKLLKSQMVRGESLTLSHRKLVYLADLSVNHLAEEAAHMLRYFCAGAEFPRNKHEAFYANILHEALAFCDSKIINHRRKCLRSGDYKKIVKKGMGSDKEEKLAFATATLFLQHEREIKKGGLFSVSSIHQFSNMSKKIFFSLSHAIGYALGEKMFYGLMQGVLSQKKVKELHFDRFEGEAPLHTVIDLWHETKKVELPAPI